MVPNFVLTVLALTTAVSSHSVEWQADYGKALAATRSDDRPLLVVLDDPTSPKTAVEDEQLDTDGEQAKLLASYQLCHVDASTAYGRKVAKVFKAERFPFTAIIDKSGTVVLTKKEGQLTDSEWNETLAAYKQGERAKPIYHATAYRGEVVKNYSTPDGTFGYPATGTSVVSPSYCPSCQKNSQRSF